MNNRIKELDYLKCIFIVLMIIFHLVYIGDKYPYLKACVYTFHMPAFLIISGYLAHVAKPPKPFFQGLLWIFIPYAFMETGYAVMSSILPVREALPEVTSGLLLCKVFLTPIGPYWYLHTLLLCSVCYYLIYNYVHLDQMSRFILLGVCFFALSYWGGVLSFSNAIYFLAGIAIHQSKQCFITLFQPSAWAVLPLVILFCFPENLNRSTLSGVAITYFVVSLLLYVHRYLKESVRTLLYFIGRNTLAILLFSPVFTIIAKTFVPFFSFDPSGILFAVVSVLFTLCGCVGIAWLVDRLNLSKICFGKKRFLQ